MQIELEYRNLIELFHKSLDKIMSLDKPCLEIIRAERQETLTFRQLQRVSREFALWLIQDRQIKINDKVAILGKNRADWDIALWGIILAGAIPVLIDPERPVEAVQTHLINTDTRLIVMADDYQDEDSRLALDKWASDQDITLIEMTVFDKVNMGYGDADELLHEICGKKNDWDTAIILCTSGTTGDPREVELTHANFIANIQGSVEKIRLSHEDTLGHILPPHHSFGLTVGKLLPFCVGANNVYTKQYRYVSELIRDKEVTIFIAVPALFTVLAKKFEEDLTTLKKEKRLVRLLDRFLPKFVGKRVVKH